MYLYTYSLFPVCVSLAFLTSPCTLFAVVADELVVMSRRRDADQRSMDNTSSPMPETFFTNGKIRMFCTNRCCVHINVFLIMCSSVSTNHGTSFLYRPIVP